MVDAHTSEMGPTLVKLNIGFRQEVSQYILEH